MGWDINDQHSVARTTGVDVRLVSNDYGEIIHVDGGYHAMGA